MTEFVVVPLAACVLAVLLSLYLAPRLIHAAVRYGIVDKPRPPLKMHASETPYLGGLVVFISFLMALAITFPFDARVLAILLAASLVVSVGLIDDLGELSPKDKLIGQIVAAIVLTKAGIRIEIEAVPSPVDEMLSILWLVTCMNAFNIVDVSDGLATTAGIVGSGAAFVVAVMNHEAVVAAMAASLFGACVGFLRFNRQPAKMYLGDTGSMVIGCLIGAFSMIGRYSEVNSVSAWLVPLCIAGIPLFDLALVILARLHAGRKIWLGSPDHFAVRLRHHDVSALNTARIALVVGVIVNACAIASTSMQNQEALFVTGFVIVFALVLMAVLFEKFPPRPKPQASPPSQP